MVPAALEEWVRGIVGPVSAFESRASLPGASTPWRIQARSGEAYYLRTHTERRKFDQERRCYEEWLSQLPNSTPTLVAVRAGNLALLITELPGQSTKSSIAA